MNTPVWIPSGWWGKFGNFLPESHFPAFTYKANDSRIVEVFRNEKILNLYSVAFLLAVMDFSQGFPPDDWPGPSTGSFQFIKGFSGSWPIARGRNVEWKVRDIQNSMEVAFHVRLFQIQSDEDDRKPVATEGVFCSRENGTIPGLKKRLQERRISTRTCFTLHSIGSPKCPIHSTLILNDVGKFRYDDDLIDGFMDDDPEDPQGSAKLNRNGRAAGLISFQLALWGVIDMWQEQWTIVLDEIDSCVRSKVREIANSIHNLLIR